VFPLSETGQTQAITAEVPVTVLPPAVERRTTRPIPDEELAALSNLDGVSPAAEVSPMTPPPSTVVTPVEAALLVSPSRRTQGTIVAVVLFVALVAGAIWFVYHTAQKVTPNAASTPESARGDSVRMDSASRDSAR
jgi:hypothetical protein